jgi:hypothetical protein
MSVASLSKFTVPISGAGSQGILMPKLKYRFRAIFENFGVSSPRAELTKNVMDITKPSLTHEMITIDVYNSKINMAGKHTWDPVTVNLRDDANGETSRRVGEQMQKQFDHFEQASAVAGIDYKFLLRFEVLDGGNGGYETNVLESWEMYGCYIENVNYNDANYQTSDPMSITLQVRYDNALNVPLETGIGSAVGRAAGSIATG